jgi:hypothetical protein
MRTMSKRITSLPASLAGFTPMELNKRLPLAEAAALNRFKDPETFKKHYPHLVRRIGKRRLVVTLYDALMLPPPDQAATD